MKVLIVDDHEIVRRGERDLFEGEFPGIQVGEAGNTEAALEALMRERWDLVLLDRDLPGRGGFEVLREARRLQPRTAVLVFSVYPEGEVALRALRLGASGYLSKDRGADELLAAVRKLMAGGRYITAPTAEQLASSLGPDQQKAPHERLSERELQIFRRVAEGATLRQIAGELRLSEKTAGTYRARIGHKTGIRKRTDLVRYAIQHQLVR